MSRKTTRRIMAAGVAIVGMAGVAACSGGGGSDNGGGGGGEFEVWTHAGGGAEELAAITAIVDDYNASQDTYTAKLVDFPQASYNQAVVAAATSNKLPCIVDVDGPNVPNWVWAGYIEPLGISEDWDQHLPGTLGVIDGEVYSFGYFDAALAMFTRQSTLDAAGVRTATVDEPWTKEEFEDALAKIDALGQFDFAIDLSTSDVGEWYPYAYSPLLQSFGGDLINRSDYQSADGALNGPEALAWANWFRGLVTDGYMPEVSGASPADDFANGTSGILYSGNWNAKTIRATFDDAVVMPPPDLGNGPKIGAGSWQWALTTGCEMTDGARDYLEFAQDTKYYVSFYDAIGLVPGTFAAADEIPSYSEGGEDRIFLEMADKFAVVRPETPAYPFISSVFIKAGQDILAGGDPQSILDRAVTEIDADISQNGGYEF